MNISLIEIFQCKILKCKLFLLIFEIDIHVALSFFSVGHDYNFFMYS